MPGMERSALQAAAAREAEGHGRIAPTAGQQEPGGLFAPQEAPQPGLFDRELAEAEAAAAHIDQAELLPEERAEIAATAQNMTDAGEIASGMAEAASCITGGFSGGA